jgi:hypothetical protein
MSLRGRGVIGEWGRQRNACKHYFSPSTTSVKCFFENIPLERPKSAVIELEKDWEIFLKSWNSITVKRTRIEAQ